MAARRESRVQDTTSRRPPATTPEGRERQLVSLAYDLAEERIRSGSASAQEVSHFLKMGSSREFLEQERLRHENVLTQTKIDTLKAQASIEALYKEALNAMSAYQGREAPRDPDEQDD